LPNAQTYYDNYQEALANASRVETLMLRNQSWNPSGHRRHGQPEGAQPGHNAPRVADQIGNWRTWKLILEGNQLSRLPTPCSACRLRKSST
jgi:hypothetical protein